MNGHGISVSPLPGWDIRIARRPAPWGERTHAVLHAATFALPEGRGDYGDGAVQRMARDDVFLALVEFAPSATATPLFRDPPVPRSLSADEFARTTLQHAAAGQSGLQRFFTERGRAWCLYVVIGSHDRRVVLTRRVNQLLSGMTLEGAA